MAAPQPHRWDTFLASVFFVLGFASVFALAGVLLQGVLASVSFTVQRWFGRIRPKCLEREYKLTVRRKFKSFYATSFVFGAAFAVGWTPCVGAVLGAVLTLAATQPGMGFLMLLSYALGLGIPFLLVGLFANEAQRWLSAPHRWLQWLNVAFGVVLIVLGILVFTSQLARVANLAFAANILLALDAGTAGLAASLNIGVAFLAGIVSFLSPCVLPLIPAFLAYLASAAVRTKLRDEIP